MPRTSFTLFPENDNPFQQGSSADSTPEDKEPKAPTLTQPSPSSLRPAPPNLVSPLFKQKRSSSIRPTGSPPVSTSDNRSSELLSDATAALTFADTSPTNRTPVYRSPSKSEAAANHEDALRKATVAGLEAELRELQDQNARLQSQLDEQRPSEDAPQQKPAKGTHDRPTSASAKKGQGFGKMVSLQLDSLRNQEHLRVLSEDRRRLADEAKELKAQAKARDADLAQLRESLDATQQELRSAQAMLEERDAALANAEATHQTRSQELQEQQQYWQDQALHFSKEGQKCWLELQQQTTAAKATQMSLDYERDISRSNEGMLKDLNDKVAAIGKEKQEQVAELEKQKQDLKRHLKSSRADTERVFKEKQALQASVQELTARIDKLDALNQSLKQAQEQPASARVTAGSGAKGAVAASRTAVAAQKSNKYLQALFDWAAVQAHIEIEPSEDDKVKTTSIYNRASLLLSLTWPALDKERLEWAQKDCAALLSAQPDYFKAHRLQARLHMQRKAPAAAITSFRTAIRLAEAAPGDQLQWIATTDAELQKAKKLQVAHEEAELRAKEQVIQREFDDFMRGKYLDWQILGLSGSRGFSKVQVSNAAKALANKYHPDKPRGNTKIMQRIFQARDNCLKKAC